MRKIIWKVADKPTGRYRAFEHRAWPAAWWGKPGQGEPAAFISCGDEYAPWRVREGKHAPLHITVCHYQHPEAGNSSKRFRLKKQAATLDEAKQMIQAFYESHQDWLPKEKQA